MHPHTKEFTNELGHAIALSVHPEPLAGVPGIFISIAGPTSLAENHITHAEAQVLYELLGTALQRTSAA